jgi:hypothetical protein
MKTHTLLTGLTLAASLIAAAPAFAGSTITVPDGKGGWTPYVHEKPPAGPTGISVGDGRGGWKPYLPKPKPGPGISVQNEDGEWVPYVSPNPRVPAPQPIRHVKGSNGWTYYLSRDRTTGSLFVQIEDADGRDIHINGEVPLPGGGQLYPVR